MRSRLSTSSGATHSGTQLLNACTLLQNLSTMSVELGVFIYMYVCVSVCFPVVYLLCM